MKSKYIIKSIKFGKENKEDLDELLNLIKETCLTRDLRVGQLFENLNNFSEEKDLFYYSNERLIKLLEKFNS